MTGRRNGVGSLKTIDRLLIKKVGVVKSDTGGLAAILVRTADSSERSSRP